MATAQERLNQYEELFKKSQSYDPNKFREDFTKAYDQETNYNKDLIEERSNALSNLQRVAPTLRERYADSPIRNPLTHWRLIADQRQPYIGRMSNAEGMLGARGYRFADILRKASGQYESDTERALRATENAWRLYQDQLGIEERDKDRRAQAAASAGYFQSLLNGMGGGNPDNGGGDIVRVQDTPTAPQKKSYTDRLVDQVLEMRGQNGLKNVLRSYWNTEILPLKHIESFKDVIDIPINSYASGTVIANDLWNRAKRLLKR